MYPLRTNLLRLAAAAGLVALAAPAGAQGIQRLGDYDAWSAFRFTENGKVACYMSSVPNKATGKYKKRGDIFAIVAHWPSEDRRDEFSIVAGYKYKPDSRVKVTIDGTEFRLFTEEDGAWAPDKKADRALVAAMIKGRSMVVKGTSSRGTRTTDTYALGGFTKAYKAISEACPKK